MDSRIHIFSYFNNSKVIQTATAQVKTTNSTNIIENFWTLFLGHILLSYLPRVAAAFICIFIIPFFTIIVFYIHVYTMS
jgi:hypothetical protein